jgi:hypothetical protein
MKLQKEDGYYYLMEDGNDIAIATTDQSFIDELGAMKLSKQNCDEIFGVVDVEKLAYETYEPETFVNHSDMYRYLCIKFFKEGFNKAMELNKDKLFTADDMLKTTVEIWNTCKDNKHDETFTQCFNKTLKSLQQPTEIEVEIEMREDYLTWKQSDIEKMSDCLVPKLDENGCLILKKK